MLITVQYIQRDGSLRNVVTDLPEAFGIKDYGQPCRTMLGQIFRTMNCVDGDPETELCCKLRVRSMMVGDKVLFEDGSKDSTTETYAFTCESVGWSAMALVPGR